MTTAFAAGAFQNNAFQIDDAVIPPVGADGGGGGKHLKAHYRARVARYQAFLEEEKRLQEEASGAKAKAVKAKAKLKKLKKKPAVSEFRIDAALLAAEEARAEAQATAAALEAHRNKIDIEDDDEEVLWFFMSQDFT